MLSNLPSLPLVKRVWDNYGNRVIGQLLSHNLEPPFDGVYYNALQRITNRLYRARLGDVEAPFAKVIKRGKATNSKTATTQTEPKLAKHNISNGPQNLQASFK